MKASSVVFLSVLCSHPVLFQGGSVVYFFSVSIIPPAQGCTSHKQTFTALSSALCPSAILAPTSNKPVAFTHPCPGQKIGFIMNGFAFSKKHKMPLLGKVLPQTRPSPPWHILDSVWFETEICLFVLN